VLVSPGWACPSSATAHWLSSRRTASPEDVAIAHEAMLLVIETRCQDAALWRQRIEQRSVLGLAAHHQTTWDGLRRYLVEAEPRVHYPIPTPLLIVDTTTQLPVVAD